MEQKREISTLIEQLAYRSEKFKKEAYFFVFDALEYTLKKLGEHRHVSGRELLYGISEYAKAEYGPMTKTVFEYWGVTKTRDFGYIVFDLIDVGLMGKTENDTIDDFTDIFYFEEEFDLKYGKVRSEE